MKVYNKMDRPLQNAETSKARKSHTRRVDAFANSGANRLGKTQGLNSSAKVDLSSRAQMLQKAKEIASSSGVDEAKVARLQKLIDSGNYKVDSAAVADKLIDTHMEFPD